LAAGGWEAADVVGQGLAGPVVAPGGAAVLRTPNGVAASLRMSTPEPGSYTYPTGPTGSGIAGHPEAFSLWVFIFYNPEACAGAICGPGDLMNNPDVIAGAYNAGGHLEGGPNLTLQGFVNQDSFTFGGPNAEKLGQASRWATTWRMPTSTGVARGRLDPSLRRDPSRPPSARRHLVARHLPPLS
jgi:hypothetical protein